MRSSKFLFRFVMVMVISISATARAEVITVGTYNVELFRNHFSAQMLATQPAVKAAPELKEYVDLLRKENDENNWETSQVILDPKFNPDVLVMQECANQKDIEYFNRRWLKGMFETVIIFNTNTTFGQNLAVMLKPGFKVLEKKEHYAEPDTVANERGERLFARGPGFVHVQTPAGFKVWIGTTHQKSKRGNNVDVTRWRNREAVRTNQIMQELRETGSHVLLLGDCNDETGLQEFEQEGGGDVMSNLVGPPEGGFVLLTKPLVDAGKVSFGGYTREDFRSFIDHIVASKDLAARSIEVDVYQDGLARVSSDHYPVYVKLKTSDAPTTRP